MFLHFIIIRNRYLPDIFETRGAIGPKTMIATLNRLIKEIVVHEHIDSDKTRHMSIEIHFNLKPIPEVEQVLSLIHI